MYQMDKTKTYKEENKDGRSVANRNRGTHCSHPTINLCRVNTSLAMGCAQQYNNQQIMWIKDIINNGIMLSNKRTKCSN